MKKLQKFLMLLCLWALLLPHLITPAYAGDWDYIDEYHVTVTPNTDDGSLHIEVRFRWTVLEEGPVEWLTIGIPNGSIREETALTDNIDSLSFDNSYMYVYFNQGYDDGETFEFAYSWVQEYMYRLVDDAMVSYDYTPGWFDEANIGLMTLTWMGTEGTAAEYLPFYSGGEGELLTEPLADGGFRLTGENLSHGATMKIVAQYSTWPTQLYWENSAENIPTDDWEYEHWQDDYYEEDYSSDGDIMGMLFMVIFVIAVIIIISSAVRGDGYAGGFGTRYVLYHGLWYPMGRDGRPRPGSVGTKHKPKPPTRSGGGFGGGSRGGGFGGGGFSGGSHCACASSCACACACACAGGGRAGCSAKNLYGAVKLDEKVTKSLEK